MADYPNPSGFGVMPQQTGPRARLINRNPNYDALFNTDDLEARNAELKRLGVVNTEPPLPHSPCLKNKRTGRVLPWNELLANQHDLVECCDANGNTDEAAWGPLVVSTPVNEGQLLALKARAEAAQARIAQQNSRVIPPASRMSDGTKELQKHGAMLFSEIDNMIKQLRS